MFVYVRLYITRRTPTGIHGMCYTRGPPRIPPAQSDYVSGVPSPLKSICARASVVARNSRRIPRSLPFFRLARAAGFGRFLLARASDGGSATALVCVPLSIAAKIGSENSSLGSTTRPVSRKHRRRAVPSRRHEFIALARAILSDLHKQARRYVQQLHCRAVCNKRSHAVPNRNPFSPGEDVRARGREGTGGETNEGRVVASIIKRAATSR